MKFIIRNGYEAWYRQHLQNIKPPMTDGDIVEYDENPVGGKSRNPNRISVRMGGVCGSLPTAFLMPIATIAPPAGDVAEGGDGGA